MEIKHQGVTLDIPKSTGRMVTLMSGLNLPLEQYNKGRLCLYTLAPFGPRSDFPFDWYGSYPTRFNDREVTKALATGLVVRDGFKIFLSDLGIACSTSCAWIYGPVLDEYFKGRGVDWRTMRV